MMTRFEEEHASFIQAHLDRRRGERRDRLARGHSHAERLFLKWVWWPLFGHFHDVHPEYEVLDWRGVPYFLDFAYIRFWIKLGFEIKGYGPHVRDADRTAYSRELNREAFLTSQGWRILSFSYDDVKERPEVVKMLIKMNLAPYTLTESPVQMPVLIDNELIRLALALARPIRPIDVEQHFAINHRTAVRWIQQACERGWLRSVTGGRRVVHYELVGERLQYWV